MRQISRPLRTRGGLRLPPFADRLPDLTSLPARGLVALSLLFNLPFVVAYTQRQAFDTYTHIFLADHYRRAWWSLWEPRWYMGFSMASYPPLAHQLMASLSRPYEALVRLFAIEPEAFAGAHAGVGLEMAYVTLLVAALALLPLAIRAFARVFVGPRASGLAALFAVVLPAASLAAWSFGQLPTLLATSALLGALARGHAYVVFGRRLHLAQAVALAAVAGAVHHGVFLLAPFAGLAVAWRALAVRHGGAASWRTAGRLTAWVLLSALAVTAVLWPFLAWSAGQDLQTPIDHASRRNVLLDLQAAAFFFLPVYGPLLLLLPSAALAFRLARLRPLLLLFAALFVLGLGGATPLPRLLFGAGWEWLTYDRFALWAAACLLPFAGVAALRRYARSRTAGRAWTLRLLAALLVWAAGAGWLAVIGQSQPPAVDMAAIVNFLNHPDHQPYRYLTLGFGDQMSRLAALTTNGTPDGNYHTARQLPELRASGLGTLDGAIWNPNGASAVRPFLARAAGQGVRWVFVRHPGYTEALITTGWRYRGLVGNVEVWDRLDVRPAVYAPAPAETRGLAAVWWGSVPLVSLAAAAGLLAAGRRWPPLTRARLAGWLGQARRVGWSAAFALMFLLWVSVLRPGAREGVYFTYQSILIFASEMAVAVVVGLWLLERRLGGGPRLRLGPPGLALGGLALLVVSLLSVLPSSDRPLSLALSAHLALLAVWYLLTLNAGPAPARAGILFGAALAAQSLLAITQAALQSTAGLQRLNLPWPGTLEAAMRGASVVEAAGGLRWLRAYGSLPHPNILAGFLVLLLAGAAERYLSTGRRAWLLLSALGAAALTITFSRAGWLAALIALALGAWAVWRYAPLHRPRFMRLAAAGALAALASLAPLLPYLTARVSVAADNVEIEQRSLDQRQLLNQEGWNLLRANPLLGVGGGMFVLQIAELGRSDLPLEPVHNVPLLIAAEMGMAGALAALVLGLALVWRLWRRRRAASVAEACLGLALLGLFAASLFDHYWWTLAPARLLMVTAVALWAGWGAVPANLPDSRGR